MKAKRITGEELKKMLDEGEEVTLLDVRKPKDYDSSGVKLPGAVRIPLDELDERLEELVHDRSTVVYCA